MNNLAEILEEELEEAVEVKNKKSLHRYVTLLVDNIAQKEATNTQFLELKNEIKILAETMKLGFENNDKRFEDMNKRFGDMNNRFEDMNKRFGDMNNRFGDMNNRFGDMNNRFGDMNKKINILIWVISLWMSLFTAISFFLRFFK